MARPIIALIAVAVIFMAGLQATTGALVESGDDNSVINESFTPQAGSYVTLDESKVSGAYYEENVTVEDETGTEMDPGTDYVWNDSFEEGTIKAVSGGGLDGDTSATINYSYDVTDQSARDTGRFIGITMRWIAVGVMVALLLAVFVKIVVSV